MSAALFGIAANSQLCFAETLLAMSGPLTTDTNPAMLDMVAFGRLDIGGAISGLAFLQDSPSNGDKRAVANLDDALLFVQRTHGWLQFFAALGAYSFPSLGSAYLGSNRTVSRTYGDIPEAFWKAAIVHGFSLEAGKLPSLIGDEAVFTIQNTNVERGLLWNQTPTISRGVQLNYVSGAVSLCLSWNDGFYSNRFNWITGMASCP